MCVCGGGGGLLNMAPQGLRLHKATQGPARGGGGWTSGQGADLKASSCPLRAEFGAAVWEGGSDLGSGSDMGLETLRPPCQHLCTGRI